jgi:hypothetical protein
MREAAAVAPGIARRAARRDRLTGAVGTTRSERCHHSPSSDCDFRHHPRRCCRQGIRARLGYCGFSPPYASRGCSSTSTGRRARLIRGCCAPRETGGPASLCGLGDWNDAYGGAEAELHCASMKPDSGRYGLEPAVISVARRVPVNVRAALKVSQRLRTLALARELVRGANRRCVDAGSRAPFPLP